MTQINLRKVALLAVNLIFTSLFTLVSQTVAQDPDNNHLENLGVFTFDARGVSEIVSLAITDRVRYEIQKKGGYSVIERDKMNLILKEQAFQQSGACLDASCLVEVGKLLAVTKMLGGRNTKIGNLYTLEIRSIDI